MGFEESRKAGLTGRGVEMDFERSIALICQVVDLIERITSRVVVVGDKCEEGAWDDG